LQNLLGLRLPDNIRINNHMKFPVTIHIGNIELPLHGLSEFAAYFIGFRYFLHLRKRQTDTISTSNRLWILIGAIFGSIIGSRIVGGLEDLHQLQIADNKLLYFYLNKTVLGGFLFGVWGVEVIKLIIKEKQNSGDLFTYPMILALMIGRLGCFSMGVYEETYGTPTTFLSGMNLGDNMLRHPVALYEIVFLGLLWIVLMKVESKYYLANGLRFKIFMMAYFFYRFAQDFIKPHYTWGIGLSTIQIVSLIGLLYYIIIYFQHKELFLIERKGNEAVRQEGKEAMRHQVKQ